MNYRIVAPMLSLSLSVLTLGGVAMAQELTPTTGLITDASGNSVNSTPGTSSNGDGQTIIYGDITTGPGYTVIGAPPTTTTGPAPVGPGPAPVDGGTVPVDTAPVPVAGDADGDNLADNLEAQNGTNANNADTDGDGAADGDEINIYFTGPTNPDSDGDGLTDGNELFWTHTDPVRWDTDGDGWGDGDEVNTQGTDPVSATSFPGSGSTAAAPVASTAAPSTYQAETAAPVTETAAPVAETAAPVAESAIVTEPVDTLSSNIGPSTSSLTTALPGETTSFGNGYVTAAPGLVESPTVSTGVAAPAPVEATSTVTEPVATYVGSCADYGTWYDAQVAYEGAGGTSSSLAGALDPDGNGTACESMQQL